tara:strand:- start:1658 stop:2287 length:630 start_codon:yes stop_codon:yes gene_type:complete
MPEPMGGFMFVWPFIIGAFLAYLVGSVPFGLIISKIFNLPDPRKIGSKNIGATNVLRSGNKIAAGITLLFDFSKGIGPVFAAMEFGLDMAFYVSIAAVLGHIFPFWLKFRGGKGVATGIGVLIGFYWPIGLLICCVWIIIAITTKFSSIAAIIAISSIPLLGWCWGDSLVIWLGLFISVLVIAKHKANIKRLFSGQEPKISFLKNKNNV